MVRPHITAAQLKQWRKEIGATQAETAQALGFAWRTVAGWEIGEHPIPPVVAVALPQAAVRIRDRRRHTEAREREKRRAAYRERQEAKRREHRRVMGERDPAAWW